MFNFGLYLCAMLCLLLRNETASSVCATVQVILTLREQYCVIIVNIHNFGVEVEVLLPQSVLWEACANVSR